MDLATVIMLLVGLTVAFLAYGVYQAVTRRKAIVAQRVETYAGIEEEAAREADDQLQTLSPVARLFHRLLGGNYLERVQESLSRADLPVKPSEYILIRLLVAAVGYLIGAITLGHVDTGIALAFTGWLLPAIVVWVHQRRRTARFVQQLADALMLLTTSLRSGYSFLKGLELVAREMEDPISKELHRMLREVSLGATIENALLNLGTRIKSQDLDIVISAYLVQKDVGGNLTEIMEKVAETIRERLRIQGDIRVLTAQGRFSGLVVGLLPVGVFAAIWSLNREYFDVLLGPPIWGHIFGWAIPQGVWLLIGAVGLELIGAYLIYRIVNIKV